MVFAEEKLRYILLGQGRIARHNLFAKQVSQQQFFLQPHRHGGKKGLQAARRKPNVGFEEPLEFDQRLVIKHNVLKILDSDPSLIQTVLDGTMRKSWIMLLSREPLFLCGRDDPTVPY